VFDALGLQHSLGVCAWDNQSGFELIYICSALDEATVSLSLPPHTKVLGVVGRRLILQRLSGCLHVTNGLPKKMANFMDTTPVWFQNGHARAGSSRWGWMLFGF
jgi:hypothetical protein